MHINDCMCGDGVCDENGLWIETGFAFDLSTFAPTPVGRRLISVVDADRWWRIFAEKLMSDDERDYRIKKYMMGKCCHLNAVHVANAIQYSPENDDAYVAHRAPAHTQTNRPSFE